MYINGSYYEVGAGQNMLTAIVTVATLYINRKPPLLIDHADQFNIRTTQLNSN